MSMDIGQLKGQVDLRAFITRHYGTPVFQAKGDWTTYEFPPFKPTSDSRSFRACAESWIYFAGGDEMKGDVFDLICQTDNCDLKQAAETVRGYLGGAINPFTSPAPRPKPTAPTAHRNQTIAKTYDYTDQLGRNLFQVVRFEPKDFRQRHRGSDGKWIWSLDGVERTLYHLPEVIKADKIWLVEGEKDVETLRSLGLTATTNPCGSGGWREGFVPYLEGKKLVICPDADEPGEKWLMTVLETLEGKVPEIRIVRLKDAAQRQHLPEIKDITEFCDEFSSTETAQAALDDLLVWATLLPKGIMTWVKTRPQLRREYEQLLARRMANKFPVSLEPWVSRFGRGLGPFDQGDLVVFLGDTNTCKSYVLQHVAQSLNPLPVLYCSLELAGPELGLRFNAMSWRVSRDEASSAIFQGLDYEDSKPWDHVYVLPPHAGLGLPQIAAALQHTSLFCEQKPVAMLVDYLQMFGVGTSGADRYTRIADAAEGLRLLAGEQGMVVFAASQITRHPDDKKRQADPRKIVVPGLHEAKATGEIENSATCLIGMGKNDETLILRVLKNTKGPIGQECRCVLDWRKTAIFEQP